jgi:hypothetical protein
MTRRGKIARLPHVIHEPNLTRGRNGGYGDWLMEENSREVRSAPPGGKWKFHNRLQKTFYSLPVNDIAKGAKFTHCLLSIWKLK